MAVGAARKSAAQRRAGAALLVLAAVAAQTGVAEAASRSTELPDAARERLLQRAQQVLPGETLALLRAGRSARGGIIATVATAPVEGADGGLQGVEITCRAERPDADWDCRPARPYYRLALDGQSRNVDLSGALEPRLVAAAIDFLRALPLQVDWLSPADMAVVYRVIAEPSDAPYRWRIQTGDEKAVRMTLGLLMSFHDPVPIGEPQFRFQVHHVSMPRAGGWPRLTDDGFVLPGPSCLLMRTPWAHVQLKLRTAVAGAFVPEKVTVAYEYSARDAREPLRGEVTARIDDLGELIDLPDLPLRWSLVRYAQPTTARGLLVKAPLARGRELSVAAILCEDDPDEEDSYLDWYYLAGDAAEIALRGPRSTPRFVLDYVMTTRP